VRSLWLLVVVLVALFVFGGCGDSGDDSASTTDGSSAEAEPSPQADTRGQTSFRIIERPRGPQDRLPKYAEMSFGGGGMSGYEVDTEASRLAGRRAGVKLYVIPGDRDICISTPNGAGGCATKKDAAKGFLLVQQSGPPLLAADEARSWGLLPDGPDAVTATFDDGTTENVTVENNVWAMRSRRTLNAIKWESAEASGRVRIPG